MTQTPLTNQPQEELRIDDDFPEGNNNFINNAIAGIQAESESINDSPIVQIDPIEEEDSSESNSPPRLTLEVSERDINGRTGSLSFNDIDGEGWADLQPENYAPSSLGAFSITAPDSNGFSSWSYQPGRSLDSGEYAIDSYLIEDSQGAEYQIDIAVSGEDDLSSIDGVLNAVIVDGKPIGQSTIQGEGAGPAATTSALISDISSILRGNIKFPFSLSSIKRKKLKFENINERFFSAYFRFEVLDKPGVLSSITNVFSKNKTSIKRLIQNPNKNKKISSVIVITHDSKDKYLNKILKEISKKNYIKRKPKLIRIDD